MVKRPAHKLTPDALRSELQACGISPTAQRLAISQQVLGATDHPTAQEIYERVQDALPMVSQATVYNTLNLLVTSGLTREVRDGPQGTVRYDGNTTPHHHLVDVESGKIVDIDFDDIHIANLDALKKKYKVDRVTVTIEGRQRSPKHKPAG